MRSVAVKSNNPNWLPRPKSLTEKGYRKHMAKQKQTTVNGQEFALQSVSPSWFYDHNDDCGMTGGNRDTKKYVDGLIRNCVVSPPEIANSGLKFFDEKDDIKTPMGLVREIESFLTK